MHFFWQFAMFYLSMLSRNSCSFKFDVSCESNPANMEMQPSSRTLMILEIYNNWSPPGELSGPQKLDHHHPYVLFAIIGNVCKNLILWFRSAHSRQAAWSGPLFHPNSTINTQMQCRDLNVLYALHVNLHYMYKLWECVSFFIF